MLHYKVQAPHTGGVLEGEDRLILREYKLLIEIEHNFLILRKYKLLIFRKYCIDPPP
jgi:hypothetical protein